MSFVILLKNINTDLHCEFNDKHIIFNDMTEASTYFGKYKGQIDKTVFKSVKFTLSGYKALQNEYKIVPYLSCLNNKSQIDCLIDLMLTNVKDSWKQLLKDRLNRKDMRNNLAKILDTKGRVLPCNPNNWLRAFHYFEIKDLKLVILAQDPYPGKDKSIKDDTGYFANGLSFSVNKELYIPKSLLVLYEDLMQEYMDDEDDFMIPNHGDLTEWAEQGVLLLNSSLTVEYGSPDSHSVFWKEFTDDIIRYISSQCDNVVFLLMGNKAKNKANLITDTNNTHKLVKTCHPAADDYIERYLFGMKPFKLINRTLEMWGKKIIEWNLKDVEI